MSSGSHDLVLFLGRFHPVLVHLPIGGLVLLGVLELLAKFSCLKGAAQSNRLILGLTAAASVTAALLGWMLSQAGGYDPQLLPWHKWTGFAVAATCMLAWLLNWRGRPRAYRISLLATLLVLVVASHLGASITHGRGFLTQYAPKPLRTLLGGGDRPAAAPGMTPEPNQQPLFSDLIQPILQRRCSACHGPEKHKGDLSLESYNTLLKGGKNGPVLIAGRAVDSPMIHRLLLPLNDDDHMPPEGKPQPTLPEIAALQWWIERGAPVDKTIGDLRPGPEVRRILSAAQAPPE
ncbi:MAG: c-type cytochrome domain-containing protein [Limisphaerales bacterium]